MSSWATFGFSGKNLLHDMDSLEWYGSYNVENVQSRYSIIIFDGSVYYSFSWQEVILMLCWFYRAAQILCK